METIKMVMNNQSKSSIYCHVVFKKTYKVGFNNVNHDGRQTFTLRKFLSNDGTLC